jgi:ornithine cyclodeaminase/alanine dehydrogenase-like protein (mu-crystallin family)
LAAVVLVAAEEKTHQQAMQLQAVGAGAVAFWTLRLRRHNSTPAKRIP